MGALKYSHQRKLVLKLLMAFFVAIVMLYLMTDLQLQVPPPRRPPVPMYHDEPLLNLTNFHLITSPYACQSRQEVKALLVITSHSGNVDARMAWRNGMPTKTLDELKVRMVFLVALPKLDQNDYIYVPENQVREEADENMDIVQGNFLEDYHNLSYKNVMGLQWGVQFCPQAQMLIKIDDDTAINLPRILQLAPPFLQNGTMIGAISRGALPMRHETKWIVSLEQWPGTVYPDYLLGLMYITTPSVAAKVISALGSDFFWIDDVFITGVGSERAKVPLVDFYHHFTLQPEDVRCCVKGGGCEFLAALTSGNWAILEQYHRLTLTSNLDRKGRGGCTEL